MSSGSAFGGRSPAVVVRVGSGVVVELLFALVLVAEPIFDRRKAFLVALVVVGAGLCRVVRALIGSRRLVVT